MDHVDPATRGDPERPLLWVSKSCEDLAEQLTAEGHPVSPTTVRRVLRDKGFSMQRTRKTLEGQDHPDRNAQFEKVQQQVKLHVALGQPVISVDTKKKKLVGNYANGGQEWHPKGEPTNVLSHDFPNGTPKAVPYGIYVSTHRRNLPNRRHWVTFCPGGHHGHPRCPPLGATR